MITADEAQAILDALNAPRARHSLNCHTHRDCDGCRDDDRRDSLCLHNAETLARAFVAQATELARLRTAAREYLAARAAAVDARVAYEHASPSEAVRVTNAMSAANRRALDALDVLTRES